MAITNTPKILTSTPNAKQMPILIQSRAQQSDTPANPFRTKDTVTEPLRKSNLTPKEQKAINERLIEVLKSKQNETDKFNSVRDLLNAGANPKCTDKLNWTALMYASALGNTEIIKLLLDCIPEAERADYIRQKNNYGETALMYASQSDNAEVVKLLLEHIPEAERAEYVRQKDSYGWTALMYVSPSGNTEVVKLLLEHIPEAERAEYVRRKDNYGFTALTYASVSSKTEVVKLLLEYYDGHIDDVPERIRSLYSEILKEKERKARLVQETELTENEKKYFEKLSTDAGKRLNSASRQIHKIKSFISTDELAGLEEQIKNLEIQLIKVQSINMINRCMDTFVDLEEISDKIEQLTDKIKQLEKTVAVKEKAENESPSAFMEIAKMVLSVFAARAVATVASEVLKHTPNGKEILKTPKTPNSLKIPEIPKTPLKTLMEPNPSSFLKELKRTDELVKEQLSEEQQSQQIMQSQPIMKSEK